LFGRQHNELITRKFKHTPRIQTRSVLEEMERLYPNEFECTAASKFRSPDDVMFTSLQHYYAHAMGKAVPAQIPYRYIALGNPSAKQQLIKLADLNIDVFCLNDTIDDENVRAGVSRAVRSFLDRKYPIPSSFELPERER